MPSSKTNSDNDKETGNLTIFLVCLLAASLFWVLQSLSGTYVFKATVPYRLYDIPDGRILRSPSTGVLEFDLSCNGYNHLGYAWFRRFDTLLLSSRFATVRPNRIYFTQTQLSNRALLSLPGKFTVNAVSTDTLTFETEGILRKKVKILPSVSYKLADSVVITSKILIEPNAAILSGPESILHEINKLTTADTQLGILGTSISVELNLQLREGITSDVDKVRVSIRPERLVQRTVLIPLHCKREGWRTTTDSVEVELLVPLSKSDASLPLAIKAETKPSGTSQADIQILPLPDYFRLLKLSPERTTMQPIKK